MRRTLAGTRVILTGATGGIGRATADVLVRAGAPLVIGARATDALQAPADDVRTIVPGLTNSGFNRNMLRRDGKMNIPFGSGMPPERVAAGIGSAIRRNRRETVLGFEARWMLRFHRFLPRFTNWLITRKV